MKYLDERIIANVTLKYPSLGDRLYRYDVAINNEWDNPVFIGNCFIGADVTTKTIDITDIVRNYYDFSYPYKDTYFQIEWQVRIWLDTDELEHSYSDKIGIYPIYRYPNRKARMETPLSNNWLNWYIPALQGFNSDKKGEFLPHIPFVFSDKVDYNIALNIGNLSDANPYLYTGVKKELKTADFGIYNTQYKLSELWKGAEVETLDWDFTSLNDYITAFYEPPTGYYSFTSLTPLSYKAYVYNVPTVIYDFNSEAEHTSITTFPFTFDAENTGEPQKLPIDLYLQDADGNDLLNIYPGVTKSCKATVHCEIKEDFLNDYTLITNAAGEVTQTNDYWLIDTPLVAELTITFRDERDAIVKTLTISQGNDTFSILDTEGITEFEFSANGQNYDFNLDERCYAGNGSEYIFTFTLEGIDIKIYPIISRYTVDATFRTYRVFDSPLTQDNITIQNDGTDNLTAADELELTPTTQNIEVIYGQQTIDIEHHKLKLINSQLTNPNNSYAAVSKNGKLLKSGTDFITGANKHQSLGFIEGDFILYIFATSGANYEVTKITTINFGIAKSFKTATPTGRIGIISWNTVLNNSTKYQQYVASKNIIEVAKVDNCPSRYYLQWRDRYGSMQMQPFCKIDTYSEDLTRTEIKNYQDTRSLSNISIQPKWKLNTKWLNNTVYPYYESLLVSPWIKLYDTKEDTVYDVIITSSDYTEKTFKNQSKQQFNLQIDVEAVNTQNILY